MYMNGVTWGELLQFVIMLIAFAAFFQNKKR